LKDYFENMQGWPSNREGDNKKKKKRPLIQNLIYFSSTCPAPSNPVKTSLDPRQRGPIPDSSGE